MWPQNQTFADQSICIIPVIVGPMSASLKVPEPAATNSDKCNCMASRHKFNTSCKGCGWIACVNHQHSKCNFCDEVLQPTMNSEEAILLGYDEATVKAYKMLDKLLQFDKENAQRTHVHDAQADYYETGTWLTEEEKADIAKREALRQDAKKKKSHRKVNIRFDIAGRRVVDFNEEEAELADAEEVPGSFKVCSVQLDNDGERPAWMYDETPLVESMGQTTIGGQKACATQNDDEDEDFELPVYDNVGLERNRGKAGEVYRSMKKRYVDYCVTARFHDN